MVDNVEFYDYRCGPRRAGSIFAGRQCFQPGDFSEPELVFGSRRSTGFLYTAGLGSIRSQQSCIQ